MGTLIRNLWLALGTTMLASMVAHATTKHYSQMSRTDKSIHTWEPVSGHQAMRHRPRRRTAR